MDHKCREMVEKMQELLDGECTEADCREVERHLHECDHCENCLESIKRTIEFVRRSREQTVPESVKKSLREILKSCLK